MSISLNVQNLDDLRDKINFIPADIQYDGQANVSSYFETTIRKDEDDLQMASLRGRPLVGKTFEVPSGYTGVIVTETRRPFSEEEERYLTASQTFQKFGYWNLDQKPSEEDKFAQAVKWVEIAKALHEPVSTSDSQGSLKSEPSM